MAKWCPLRRKGLYARDYRESMHQDHLYRRRLRISQLDALRAWTDPEVLALWFWPDAPDAVYLPASGRGDRYSISSRSLGISFSGVCLDLDRSGLDLTWHIEGLGIWHEGFDTLSVRLFPAAEGTELTLSYTVNSDNSERLTRLWAPPLDRLAALTPSALGHDLDDFGYRVA